MQCHQNILRGGQRWSRLRVCAGLALRRGFAAGEGARLVTGRLEAAALFLACGAAGLSRIFFADNTLSTSEMTRSLIDSLFFWFLAGVGLLGVSIGAGLAAGLLGVGVTFREGVFVFVVPVGLEGFLDEERAASTSATTLLAFGFLAATVGEATGEATGELGCAATEGTHTGSVG